MNINTFGAIVQGWKNVTFPSETFEKLATERAKICSACPHANTEFKFKKFTPKKEKVEEIKGLGCDICGCPLSSKVRQVMTKCPDKPARWE